MLNNCFNTNNNFTTSKKDDVGKKAILVYLLFPNIRHWLHPSHHLLLCLLRVLHQVSQNLHRFTYRLIGERNKNNPKVKNVLDIGTATGGPLKTIVHLFDNARVLGIDYNPLYIPACKKLFKDHDNVEIRYMNYYDIEREEPETMFDVIIFGSSFMILPDQTKALEIAQSTYNFIQENSIKEERSTSYLLFMTKRLLQIKYWRSLSQCLSIFAQLILGR